MTRDELLALPTVVDIVTAGRCYGIGRDRSYAMARSGEFPVPVLHIGRRLRVRSAHLVADLAGADWRNASPLPQVASLSVVPPSESGPADAAG